MSTKFKVLRFRVRRSDLAVEAAADLPAAATLDPVLRPAAGDDQLFAVHDGFNDALFPRRDSPAADHGDVAGLAPAADGAMQDPAASEEDPEAIAAAIEAIQQEGLTGRQLRLARRLAQRHGLTVASDLDAVRQLRARGIDPLRRSALLDLLPGNSQHGEPPHTPPDPASEAEAGPAGGGTGPGRALTTTPDTDLPLPARRRKPGSVAEPASEPLTGNEAAAEVIRIQRDVVRRRRRNTLMLAVRLFLFVGIPTFLCGLYYYKYATPLYETRSEFVIQHSQNPTATGSGLGGLLSGSPLATSQDSVAVQGYLQSREAMLRLDQDLGFRAHFAGEAVDPITRLSPDATMEEAFKTYTRFVRISYDPTEGLVKLNVRARDAETSVAFSRALIGYAEEQIDHLTQRMREDQMRGARESYEDAEVKLTEAQESVVRLQEQFQLMSSEAEVGLITTQIGSLESSITQDRLALQQMEANPTPNVSRMEPLKLRIATMEAEVATLRARLTEETASGQSLAVIQARLQLAQTDLETRRMLLAQSLTAMESARIEANRQTRYLSLSVSPTPPDEPAFPKAFESTLVAGLLFLGLYMLVAMTVSILREQLSA